ncbi:glycoside hydrolase [bacterium]|nr:glycoside hydrolase [bacterium]
MRFPIVIVAALIGVPASLAAAPALPFDPAALHGFNLMEKVGVDWMNNTPYREEDFALIKDFGFNYVRLPVDYRCYTVKNDWLSFREDVLRDFDQAIAWGEKYGLHVTLALHRAPGYCVNPPPEAKDLWSDDEALAAFTAHWEMFARRYQSVPASRLSFNLVNEPGGTTPENVVRVYRHVVAAIHRVTPDRVVFLDGVDGGGKTLPELASLPNVVQSGRGYFFPVTHYRASYRDVSREFMPTPSWPVQPAFNAFLYGPFWEKDGLNQPLVLRGSFPAQTLLDVRVLIVSTSATLVVKADGKPVFEKRFEPKDGVGEWAQAIYVPKWRIYQNVYNHLYTVVLPVAAKEISLELTDGDWLRFTELGLTLPGKERRVLPGDPAPRRKQQTYDLAADGAIIPPPDFDGLAPLAAIFAPLDEVKAAGGAVFMGEFGCYSKTPHDVMLAYTQSLLERCKAEGIGWAMWNFRGEFGVLDSNRSDVAYEAFKDHELDRKLMDILVRSAAP